MDEQKIMTLLKSQDEEAISLLLHINEKNLHNSQF